jgi:hypothetical protein
MLIYRRVYIYNQQKYMVNGAMEVILKYIFIHIYIYTLCLVIHFIYIYMIIIHFTFKTIVEML